jgi:expansin (peptidoglycan-binding protein)
VGRGQGATPRRSRARAASILLLALALPLGACHRAQETLLLVNLNTTSGTISGIDSFRVEVSEDAGDGAVKMDMLTFDAPAGSPWSLFSQSVQSLGITVAPDSGPISLTVIALGSTELGRGSTAAAVLPKVGAQVTVAVSLTPEPGTNTDGGLTDAHDAAGDARAGTGGTGATGGSGGGGTGGVVGTGGIPGTGTGGNLGTGGLIGTGGVIGTGGIPGTGTGGKVGTGGVIGTGGVVGTGGAGTGGKVGTGGVVGTGGTPGTGGAPTACTIGPSSSGTGSFTNYSFGQGTAMQNGYYQTACGYHGHETTGVPTSDTVDNIATTSPAAAGYFAAIPGQSGTNFDSSKYCGACARITNGGNSVIVTVIDECPENSNAPCQNNPNGHLDLSVPAFNALGYATGNPNNTSWQFVPCPVTGNVMVRIKPGNPNEIFIENEITPIASVTLSGAQAVRQSYGAWHFASNIAAGSTLMLTDIAGRALSVTVSSTTADQNQDTGHQFPTCTTVD